MPVEGCFAFPPSLLKELFPASEPGSCLLCCANVRRDGAPTVCDRAGCSKRSVFLKTLLLQLGLDSSFLPEECSQSSFPLCCCCEYELSIMWTHYYEAMKIGCRLQNKISTCLSEKKRYVPKQENGEFTKLRETIVHGALYNLIVEAESPSLRFLQQVIKTVLHARNSAGENRNPLQPPPPLPPPFLNPFYATVATSSPANHSIPTDPTDSNNMGTEASIAENDDGTRIISLSNLLICGKCGHIYQLMDQKLYEDHVSQCEAENEDLGAVAAEAARMPKAIPLFPPQSLISFDQLAALVSPPSPLPPPILLSVQDPKVYRSILKFIECEYCLEPFLGQKAHADHLRQCGAAKRATNDESKRIDTSTTSGKKLAQPRTSQATPKATRNGRKQQSNRSGDDPTHFSFKCTFCHRSYATLAKQRKHERDVHKARRCKNTTGGSSQGTPGGGSPIAQNATLTLNYIQQPTSGETAVVDISREGIIKSTPPGSKPRRGVQPLECLSEVVATVTEHSTFVVSCNGGGGKVDQRSSTSIPIVNSRMMNQFPSRQVEQQPLTPLPNISNGASQKETQYPRRMPPLLFGGLSSPVAGSYDLAEPTLQQPASTNFGMFLNSRQANLPSTVTSSSLQHFPQEESPADQAAFLDNNGVDHEYTMDHE